MLRALLPPHFSLASPMQEAVQAVLVPSAVAYVRSLEPLQATGSDGQRVWSLIDGLHAWLK
jgi:hypothetical protein